MKRYLFLLISFLFCLSTFAQTTTYSPTQFTTGLELSYGRGAEMAGGMGTMDNSVGAEIPNGTTIGKNYYYRFLWTEFENNTQGSYSFTNFDTQIHYCIDHHLMFSPALMCMLGGDNSGGTGHGATFLSYPWYLHQLMQAETTNSKDYQVAGTLDYDGIWCPNWNSTNYLTNWKALLTAIAAHIAGGSYSGVNYKDVIYYVDFCRGFGDFGEWHLEEWAGLQPTGRTATTATLDSIINWPLEIFPNYPNVINIGVFDCNTSGASRIPQAVSYFALKAHNLWGDLGWGRDNWADIGYNGILSSNPYSYDPGSGSVSFAPLIMNKYKTGMIVGEPLGCCSTNLNCSGACVVYGDLRNELVTYHASLYRNYNYLSGASGYLDTIINAAKAIGFRLTVTGGSTLTNPTTNGSFPIVMNWQNTGIAPCYEDWNVVYELRNGSGTVVWSDTSSFNPKFFLPTSGTDSTHTDTFTLTGVTAGTYSLHMILRDPKEYKTNLPLSITGVEGDGGFQIRSGIVVTAAASSNYIHLTKKGRIHWKILP